jgi:hypothetical protein
MFFVFNELCLKPRSLNAAPFGCTHAIFSLRTMYVCHSIWVDYNVKFVQQLVKIQQNLGSISIF